MGAKDLLEDGRFGMIVEPTVEGVKQGILRIMENKDLLIGYNKRIAEEMDLSKTIMSAKQIEKLYLEK